MVFATRGPVTISQASTHPSYFPSVLPLNHPNKLRKEITPEAIKCWHDWNIAFLVFVFCGIGAGGYFLYSDASTSTTGYDYYFYAHIGFTGYCLIPWMVNIAMLCLDEDKLVKEWSCYIGWTGFFLFLSICAIGWSAFGLIYGLISTPTYGSLVEHYHFVYVAWLNFFQVLSMLMFGSYWRGLLY